MKWIGFGLGGLVMLLWVINSDLVNLVVPVRTLFPILLGVSAILVLFRGAKTALATALLFSALGVYIFISGRMGYSEETISFENDGMTLEGTLYIPDGAAGPYPTVVIVHGSPCISRRVYHVFADDMARNGIAVFSFDKRGTGNSGGACVTENNTSLENLTVLAGDVAAALKQAAQHPAVDTSRLGLWGISQGGWIAPLTAEKYPDLAFIALVSGPGVSTGEENYYSALTGDGHGETENQLIQAEIDTLVEASKPTGFDPSGALEKLSIPVLWIFGGKDSSIPVKKSIKNLETLQTIGKSFEISIYPASSHVLVEMTFPYRFSEGFQAEVADWIKAQPAKTR